MYRYIALVLLSVVFSGCSGLGGDNRPPQEPITPIQNPTPPESSELLNQIMSTCGGGSTSKMTAELNSKLGDILNGTGDIKADMNQDIKPIFDSNGASDAKYKMYTDCVTNLTNSFKPQNATHN